MVLSFLGAALLAPSLAIARPPVAPPAPAAAPATWVIDKAHTDVSFRIRHLVSRVRGQFRDFEGTITADPANLAGGSVQVTVRTASVFTDNERRDTHLRSAEFFDVEKFPEMTFKSTRVETSGSKLKITGDLTIKGVTKPVVLDGEFTGIMGPDGPKQRVGFSATGTVNRLDYGVSWNRAAEGGGVVLGDEVTIELLVEAIRQ